MPHASHSATTVQQTLLTASQVVHCMSCRVPKDMNGGAAQKYAEVVGKPAWAHRPLQTACEAERPQHTQCSRAKRSDSPIEELERNICVTNSVSSESAAGSCGGVSRRTRRACCEPLAPSWLLLLLLMLLGLSSGWTAQATKVLIAPGSSECISEVFPAALHQVGHTSTSARLPQRSEWPNWCRLSSDHVSGHI